MASWQGLMTVVGALGTFLVAALTLVLSLTRTKSKVEQAEARRQYVDALSDFPGDGCPFPLGVSRCVGYQCACRVAVFHVQTPVKPD